MPFGYLAYRGEPDIFMAQNMCEELAQQANTLAATRNPGVNGEYESAAKFAYPFKFFNPGIENLCRVDRCTTLRIRLAKINGIIDQPLYGYFRQAIQRIGMIIAHERAIISKAALFQ